MSIHYRLPTLYFVLKAQAQAVRVDSNSLLVKITEKMVVKIWQKKLSLAENPLYIL